MTGLTYNGVSLPFTKSDEHEFANVMSDDGADHLYIKKTLAITATLGPEVPGVLAPGETSMAQAFQRILHAISQPRKALRWELGGIMVDSGPGSDVKNGPIPEVVSVTPIGTSHIAIRFKISTCQRECPGLANPPKWLSHRWVESVEIGDDWRSTLTRTGKIVTRSDMFVDPDALRGLVTPPAPKNCQPIRSRYEMQSDGLALSYERVFEEQYAILPYPVIKFEGTHRIFTGNGYSRWAEFHMRVVGDVTADKQRLIGAAVAAGMDKFTKDDLEASQGNAQLIGHISEKLHANEIEISLRGRLKALLVPRVVTSTSTMSTLAGAATGGQVGSALFGVAGGAVGSAGGQGGNPLLGAAGRLDNRTEPAKQKPGQKPAGAYIPKWAGLKGFGKPYGSISDAPDRGTAGLGLVAAALGDPCLAQTVTIMNQGTTAQTAILSNRPTGPANPQLAAQPAAAAAVVSFVNQVQDQVLSKTLSGGVYSYYELNVMLEEDQQISVCPEQKEGGGTEFFQLAAPTLRMIVKWSARRTGQAPEPPKKDLGDPNAVYLNGRWSPGEIEFGADGMTPTITAAGTYVYGFKKPKEAKWGITGPPWAMEILGLASKPLVYGGPRIVNPGPVGKSGPDLGTVGVPPGTVDPAGSKPGVGSGVYKPAGPGVAENQDFFLLTELKNAPPPGFEPGTSR